MKVRLRPHHAPRFNTRQAAGDPWITTLPLSGFRQTRDYTCGFATTLMVMRYFSVTTPATELYDRLGTGRDGTRQNAIVRELRAAGLRSHLRYDVDFARIVREVDRNKLIIGYVNDHEHWVVIYGYGRDPDRVFVADPEPDAGCEQPWASYGKRLGGYGIICSHPGASNAIRQKALALDSHAEDVTTLAETWQSRLPQLRCEVRDNPLMLVPPAPVQLSLPF